MNDGGFWELSPTKPQSLFLTLCTERYKRLHGHYQVEVTLIIANGCYTD